MDAAEEVVRKVFHGDANIDEKLQNFSSSLTAFQSKTGSFSRGFIWNDPLLKEAGKIHEWYQQYSLPYHQVFGHVASVVQAQLTGAGGAERNWAALEYIWDDYRVKLGPEKAEKSLLIFEGHRREMQEHEVEPELSPLWKIWTADEVAYDLGLEKYDAAVDIPVAPTTKFKNFIEGWECEATKNKSAENEFKLLSKYKGIKFYDDDEDQVYVILDTNLEWKKKDKSDRETPCYCVLAKPDTHVREEDGDLGDEECYHINEELHQMIRSDKSGNDKGLELIFA